MVTVSLSSRIKRLGKTLGEVLYGATVYDWALQLKKERGKFESLFVLVVFGEFLGIPVLPPYYTLRLLPYVVPSISTWKRSMLREPDITEIFDEDMG